MVACEVAGGLQLKLAERRSLSRQNASPTAEQSPTALQSQLSKDLLVMMQQGPLSNYMRQGAGAGSWYWGH